MDNYYLFLDETKPNITFNCFCLAGCVIHADLYANTIIPYINSLKRDIFDSESVILHEIEIRRANEAPYKVMRDKAKREDFWSRMTNLFSTPDLFVTIGAAINCDEYQRLYPGSYINDEYFIALQIILENFVHFLELNNGIGTIYIESRNHVEDERLQNHFHILKANGTLFMHRNALQRRLGTINFLPKIDNNVGLQLADFIPNPLARDYGNVKQKDYSLHPHIVAKLYEGCVSLPNRFGLKRIP